MRAAPRAMCSVEPRTSRPNRSRSVLLLHSATGCFHNPHATCNSSVLTLLTAHPSLVCSAPNRFNCYVLLHFIGSILECSYTLDRLKSCLVLYSVHTTLVFSYMLCVLLHPTPYVFYRCVLLHPMCSTDVCYYTLCVLPMCATTPYVFYRCVLLHPMCSTDVCYYTLCVLPMCATTPYVFYRCVLLHPMCSTDVCYYTLCVLPMCATTPYVFYRCVLLHPMCSTDVCYYTLCVLPMCATTPYVFYRCVLLHPMCSTDVYSYSLCIQLLHVLKLSKRLKSFVLLYSVQTQHLCVSIILTLSSCVLTCC